jgi:hypothetical protein
MLVIDDDRYTKFSFAPELNQIFKTEMVKRPKEALDRLKEKGLQSYDVILFNIGFPIG